MWSAVSLTTRCGLAAKVRPGSSLIRTQLYASRVRAAAPEARAARRRTLKEIVMAPAGESAFTWGKGALAGASAIGLGALCFYGLGMSKGIGAIDKAAQHYAGARRPMHTSALRLISSAVDDVHAASSRDPAGAQPPGTDSAAGEQTPLPGVTVDECAAPGTANAKAEEACDVRSRILRASLPHVQEHGFSGAAVAAGAQSLGLAPTVHGLFERGAGAELALFFYRDCNSQFASSATATAAAAESKAADASIKKRSPGEALRDAVVARLRLTVPYVEAWPQGMALLSSSPSVAQDALSCLAEFVDDAWHAAGDASADLSWYTKRAELAAIYKAAELFMLQDTSEDFADTWAFVDRMFTDVSAAASTIAALNAAASGLGSGLNTAMALAKNVLGLRR